MSLTLLIILATVGTSFYAWNNPSLLYKWVHVPYRVNHYREYWRLLTSGFIHNDYGHLFFNMLSLYFFGEAMEGILKGQFGNQAGGIYFLLLYLGGIILSDLPNYYKHRNNSNYSSLGASGGVSSIIFACILIYPWLEMAIYFIPIRGIFFAILYVLYSMNMAKRNYDNVNHYAHLYGALYGVVFMILILPEVVPHFVEQLLNWRYYLHF
jgi:membrane associated rhomboid family serine protease